MIARVWTLGLTAAPSPAPRMHFEMRIFTKAVDADQTPVAEP